MFNEIKAIFFIITLLTVFLSGCTEQEIKDATTKAITGGKKLVENLPKIEIDKDKLNETAINIAITLASSIKDFKQINYDTFENYEKFKSFMENANYALDIINENFGTTFNKIEINQKEFNEVARIIQKYSPLVDPYNNLIEKANKVSADNPNSITDFYIVASVFGVDVFVIQLGVIHKTVFPTLGKLNGELGLYKIRSLCGNKCFGFVLKKIYWFLREELEDFTISAGEWLGENYKDMLQYFYK